MKQERPDGTAKFRAVDHFSWSHAGKGKAGSVNGHTATCEKLKHDTLDCLVLAMSSFKEKVSEVPHLYKADIDAAFRRVPIKPEHRWACGVAFRLKDMVCSLDAFVHHLAVLP